MTQIFKEMKPEEVFYEDKGNIKIHGNLSQQFSRIKNLEFENVGNKEGIRKVGIVVMFRIDVGGGAPKVVVDLINALDEMGKEVYLLTPFELDFNKIKKFYGNAAIKKIYHAGRFRSFFCRDIILERKLMRKEFRKMAEEVDFIIDIDGCVMHKYIPSWFGKERYVIWRISCINPETYKLQNYVNIKMIIKNIIEWIILRADDIPSSVNVYAVDKWTGKELSENWNITPRGFLYQEVNTGKFIADSKKENIIVIFGRITPNKSLDMSMKIFAEGTRSFPDYRLIIMGGTIPETEKYIEELKELAQELRISERVEIIKDLSFEQIRDILSRAKILIDSQIGTSINISPIEAMASGCAVLMRKYSGTYTELLDNGKYGYGFDDVADGGSELEKIINLLNKKKIDTKSSVKRAEFFSSANFRKRLKSVLGEE